jgi:hypothetical protein
MRKSSKKPEVLNDRQKLFVEHYVLTLNATEAARRAGYKGDDNTLAVTGHENLRNPKIRVAVDELLIELKMSPQEILTRLAQQARAEQSQFWRCDFGEAVYLDMKSLIEAGLGHLIKSVSRDGETGKITKIEFYDAQAALVHLGKAAKMFVDKSIDVGGTIQHEHRHRITLEQARAMPRDERRQRIREALDTV